MFQGASKDTPSSSFWYLFNNYQLPDSPQPQCTFALIFTDSMINICTVMNKRSRPVPENENPLRPKTITGWNVRTITKSLSGSVLCRDVVSTWHGALLIMGPRPAPGRGNCPRPLVAFFIWLNSNSFIR